MGSEEKILKGPKFEGQTFSNESVAECVIPLLKKQPDDFVVQIDAGTGRKICSKDFLQLCLDFAEGLVKLGAQRGDVVVHACSNSIECQATALGVMFSGAIIAPIDYSLKPFEIQHLLNQFQPKHIVCERNESKEMRKIAEKLGLDAKIIILDYEPTPPGFFSLNDIKTHVNVDNYQPRKVEDPKTDIVLICCSSGSTGLPKGVALSHFTVLYNNALLLALEAMELGGSILVTSPLFWISGLILVLISSTLQQTRIIPKSLKPEDVLETIEKYEPEFALLSPPSVMLLVEHPNFSKTNVKSLKCVYTGGSLLGSNIINKVKKVWENINLYQGYGMTEFGGPISSVNPGDDLLSVGRLIAETELKIVDPDTERDLGPNEVGECRLRAERVMVGYYNNEEATKAAFDEKGWFKTGDLAYYNDEGFIYITGRIKETIKYRNFHICPGEIENFILGLPGVSDVAVVPIPQNMDYHLKAVVVKKPDSNLTDDMIIESVKKNFSDYKHLKEGVEFVDSLPRSEVGKLKRWVLQKMYTDN